MKSRKIRSIVGLVDGVPLPLSLPPKLDVIPVTPLDLQPSKLIAHVDVTFWLVLIPQGEALMVRFRSH